MDPLAKDCTRFKEYVTCKIYSFTVYDTFQLRVHLSCKLWTSACKLDTHLVGLGMMFNPEYEKWEQEGEGEGERERE